MSQPNNEARMPLAPQELQNNRKLSIRCAAKMYQVYYRTLQRRQHGTQSRRDIIPTSRKLSNLEKEILIHFIIDLDLKGFPPRYSFIKEMANCLLANCDALPIVKRQAYNFILRSRIKPNPMSRNCRRSHKA
jgi:hypothetical protein